MRQVLGSLHIKRKLARPVLTLGNFDGVHIGHQKILSKVAARAKKINGTPVLLTFSPHPVKAVAPEVSIKLIQTTEQKLASIKAAGIKAVILEPFTKKFAKMGPEEFFENVILKKIAPRQIIVGYDLTFGRRRTGSVELLEKLCAENGIKIDVVQPVFLHEVLISSTQIRLYLSRGDVEAANKLIGRPYAMEGKVIHGKGLGGELGIHTANLKPASDLILPTGIYITRTLGHVSVTDIGYNPTFGGNTLNIETHLIGFKKNIYGKKIEVEFFKRIRDEILFAGPHALKEQIKNDIEQAKRYF